MDPETLRRLDLRRWDQLPRTTQLETCQRVVEGVPGLEFRELRQFTHGGARAAIRHAVGVFRFADRDLALVPGGRITLGLAGSVRAALRRVMPPASFARFDDAGVIDNLADDPVAAGALFTPHRVVELPPFLLEQAATTFEDRDPAIDDAIHQHCTIREERPGHTVHACVVDGDDIEAALAALCPPPWRLPTLDEWQHAYAAGGRAVFPWGDAWPGTPACPWWFGEPWTNVFGLTHAHATECTAHRSVLAGGDPDGWSLNGFDAGIVRASAYVMHATQVDYSRWESYAAAGVRRVIPLVRERRRHGFRRTPRTARSR